MCICVWECVIGIFGCVFGIFCVYLVFRYVFLGFQA